MNSILKKGNIFLEIERKYRANWINKEEFIDKCKLNKPYKKLNITGPDTYYENNEYVLRWRRSKDTNELTIKHRLSESSSLVREEIDLKVPNNHPKTIIKFITSLGFTKLFRIYKECSIFWYKTDKGTVSVVFYTVRKKNDKDRQFIEIEPEKGIPIHQSKSLINEWESKLGLSPGSRLNSPLLEIYSNKNTLLLEDYKYCYTCGKKKDINDFYYSRTVHRTLDNCKICIKQIENSVKRKISKKNYYETNKKEILNYHKEYRKLNKERIKELKKEYVAKKRKTNIQFKLAQNLRTRLYIALTKNKKDSHIKALGCSLTDLKEYIEKQFYKNPISGKDMNWSNWGKGKDTWQIDHILPLCNFNLSNKKEFLKACHYSNLRPLWYEEHLEKSKTEKVKKKH